jgi:putative ABC transport system permease protein
MLKHIFKLLWNKKRSNVLLILEIFLSFAVLFAVFSFSIYNLRNFSHPAGFETKDRLVLTLAYQGDRDSAEVALMLEQLYRELKNSEYVEDVAASDYSWPYSGSMSRTTNEVEGQSIQTMVVQGDENFQRVMGLRLLEGRWFNEETSRAPTPECVVNKKFMEDYFPGRNLIDSILPLGGGVRIVGVFEDYRFRGEFEQPAAMQFRHIPSTSKNLGGILLKMKSGAPAQAEESLNKLVAGVTKTNNFNIRNIEEMRLRTNRSTWIPMIALLGVCSFLCVNVAMGLFGVLWHNIQKRRSEIGLRKAVGASGGDISRQFVLETLILALLGALPCALFAAQVPLMKIIPIAPSIFFEAIALSLLTVAGLVVLCTFVPARKASLVHPAEALHEE